ncbi:MlaD family protein [Nocardia goodfellowii]
MIHHTAGCRRALAATLVTAAITAGGCGFDPSDHAMPGTGVGGPTYRLDVEFESVLSLPAGAEVRSRGARVGSLRGITLTEHAAVAHIDVRSTAEFPPGTRAELRQTTILGDIYVALLPPDTSATTDRLGDGDTIPLQDTDPGPQLEQMLERIAMFINGGSITRLQDAIGELNTALPTDTAETRALAVRLSEDLAGAADRITDIDRAVTATEQVTLRLAQMQEELGLLFSETARRRLNQVPEFMTAVLNVVIDVNTLTDGLDWLIPRLPHLNIALEQTARIMREPTASATEPVGNAADAAALLDHKLVPFLRNPAIDLRRLGIVSGTGDTNVDVLAVLRLIGVAP